jgi:hypothetical protein
MKKHGFYANLISQITADLIFLVSMGVNKLLINKSNTKRKSPTAPITSPKIRHVFLISI